MRSLPLTAASSVNEVLVVSLTNLGDVVLTAPVLDALLAAYPRCILNVVVGPKAAVLFSGNERIRTIVFEKNRGAGYYFNWLGGVNRTYYDAVVDLRQTFLPLLIRSQARTPLVPVKAQGHMSLKHMARLHALMPGASMDAPPSAIVPKAVKLPIDDFIVIAVGAADASKRWPIGHFVKLITALSAGGERVILVGEAAESALVDEIMRLGLAGVVSMIGKTDVRELAYVLTKARLFIGNDSGVMHLANYFNVPQVVLWGRTDLGRYGPWRSQNIVLHRGDDMSAITIEEAVDAVRKFR